MRSWFETTGVVAGLICFIAPFWMFTEASRNGLWWYYGCLILIGACYTVFLEWLQRIGWRSSEYTWLEVVVGVTLTLSPANFLEWQDRSVSLEMVNYAFLATGGPVILWQIIVSVERWRNLNPKLRKQSDVESG